MAKPASESTTHSFAVRLPNPWRAAVERLRAKTGRSFSADLQRAMSAYMVANGIEPPKVFAK